MLIELAVDLAELDRLAESIDAYCETNDVPAPAAMQLNLVLEELFTNSVSYGYLANAPGGLPIQILLEPRDGGLFVEFSDNGTPYDPLAAPQPDLTLDVEDRPVGGLGVHFLRTMMSDIRYSHDDGRNRLSFSKVWTV
jgi:serine/threonine-protein kinase RsbW